MAEENTDQAGEEESGGSKKGLIMMIVVVLVAVAVSVGVTMFLLGGDDSGTEAEAAAAEPEPTGPLIYYDLKKPVLSTFNVNGRQRYMQIELSFASRDQAIIDALELHLPLIKSRLNGLFSQQDFEAIQSDENKKALRESALNMVNEQLEAEGAKPIENIYFTNFVMQ